MLWTCRVITGNRWKWKLNIEGKKITGFTNNEDSAVGLTKAVLFSLENRMKELGGKFEKGQDFRPSVISDGQLITGQNPKSALPAVKLNCLNLSISLLDNPIMHESTLLNQLI